MDDIDSAQGDICRVCRYEAQSDRPLFYPCICTGSIKYIHQDCLLQWMRYSQKEYCELCGHRFTFQPIFSPDMPRVLPLRMIIAGILAAIAKTAKSWLHHVLVGVAWSVFVPLSAYRTYRFLFRASTFDMLLSLPFDIFSTENVRSDTIRGVFVVTCTLLSFVGLVWLREQILHGGGPVWLEHDDNPLAGNDIDENAEAPRNAEAMAERGADIEIGQVDAPLLATGNDDNNNADANPPIDVPMDNAAPPAAIEEAGMADNTQHVYGPHLPLEVDGDAQNNNNNNNNINDIAGPDEAPGGGVDGDAGVGVGADADADAGAGANNDNDNDEANWNPMEWDRAAEDLTWERLLGFDGSLVFLQHVCWVISLNTMFIFIFAFVPYCLGNYIFNTLDLLQQDKPFAHFHGLITTLFGYCCIGLSLVVLHFFAHVFRMRRIRWMIGLCYILVKVSLLSVLEIGGLPLICGWWLDICSLPLFDGNIKDRIASFNAAPGTSLFVHWMFGMAYVYYFATFISLLREIVRSGVLWFLPNWNDPNFSPIQELIHRPILRHVRRLISMATMFGTAVLLMLWLPIRILKTLWPTFLPYTLSGDSEVNELNLQLFLLLIILPGFFEQSHTRILLKGLIRVWCVCVSWVLGIHSYLLGSDQPDAESPPNATNQAQPQPQPQPQPEQHQHQQNCHANVQQQEQDNAAQGEDEHVNENIENIDNDQEVAAAAEPAAAVVGAVQPPPLPAHPERNFAAMHQAAFQRDTLVGDQPYDRPTVFALRICGLIVSICLSQVIVSLLMLSVPVVIGRNMMTLWSMVTTTTQYGPHPELTSRPHELYTAALGIYLCWIISRGIAIVMNLLPQGRAAVMHKINDWLRIATKYAIPVLFVILMVGVIPLLFGLLLDLVLITTLRVPIWKVPVYILWVDWALGVLFTKIAIAFTLMGPDWHMKRAIERAYRDGLRNINLQFLIWEIAYPVITFFGLALAIPYVIAHSLVPLLVSDEFLQLRISNTIYMDCFVFIILLSFIYSMINQLKKLYVAIKVDRYLVGRRLINYEHRARPKIDADTTNSNEALLATDSSAAHIVPSSTRTSASISTTADTGCANASDAVIDSGSASSSGSVSGSGSAHVMSNTATASNILSNKDSIGIADIVEHDEFVSLNESMSNASNTSGTIRANAKSTTERVSPNTILLRDELL